MESGKLIDKAEVGKAMEKVDYDDPVCVIFTSVMKNETNKQTNKQTPQQTNKQFSPSVA